MSSDLFNRSVNLAITKRASEDASSENLVLEFPFSSEEPYVRSGYFDGEPWVEILGHKSEEVDLSRLNSGAPVLLNHGSGRTEDAPYASIGITQRAWIENGRGYVEVKLSRRDGMKSIIQDIQDGIIANVSVGYKIQERSITKRNADSPDEYRVTNWLPMEVTLCDIPADATVGIGRSITKEVEMKEEIIAPEVKQDEVRAAEVVDIKKVQSEALEAERKRVADIKKYARGVKLPEGEVDELIERGLPVEEACIEIINKLASRTEENKISSRADIFTVRDETETRRELMTEAVMYRADPSVKLSDGARQYAGLTMLELSRESLKARGISSTGMDRFQIATRAFEGTSDLPNVLANVANKSLRQAYELAPRTFTAWARQTTNPDFRTITRAMLSDAPMLEKVTENGEFKQGAVTDGKETYQLATYGKIIGITRQAIINDDLSAFTRLPAAFAMSAAALESDTVYGILTTNAALSDGVALFHASHNNLTGTGTDISVAALGTARTLMRKQKSPQGVVMNLRPRFLIVPAAKETAAAQFVSQAYVANQSSAVNPFAGSLEVIAEARLDDNSQTAWYLAADSSMIDTIEYCYLEGQNGVFIETMQGFEMDGMKIKARLDFAAKAIDHRGLYKNVGA